MKCSNEIGHFVQISKTHLSMDFEQTLLMYKEIVQNVSQYKI